MPYSAPSFEYFCKLPAVNQTIVYPFHIPPFGFTRFVPHLSFSML